MTNPSDDEEFVSHIRSLYTDEQIMQGFETFWKMKAKEQAEIYMQNQFSNYKIYDYFKQSVEAGKEFNPRTDTFDE